MFPSKVTSVLDSVLWKLPVIIEALAEGDCIAEELYPKVMAKFEDVNEFIVSIDILFLLDEIMICENYGVIKKC